MAEFEHVLNDILSRNSLALPGKYESSTRECTCVCVCVTWHCVVEFFCISLLRRALCVCRHNLLHSRQLLRQLLAFLLFQLTSSARSASPQPPPFGFCLSCEQLSCCKFIDSLYTCGCSLATFVFLVCAARVRISMCKLIKASKSKLKHFAPAACGNSIQLNRPLSHLPFILAQHDSRIINSILGAESKLGLELSLSAHIDRHTDRHT